MTNIQNQVFERSFLSKLSKYNSEMVSPIISWAYRIISYRMVGTILPNQIDTCQSIVLTSKTPKDQLVSRMRGILCGCKSMNMIIMLITTVIIKYEQTWGDDSQRIGLYGSEG